MMTETVGTVAVAEIADAGMLIVAAGRGTIALALTEVAEISALLRASNLLM